jgi:ABC-type branched-subunit amino acid transport system substrate-binding protein
MHCLTNGDRRVARRSALMVAMAMLTGTLAACSSTASSVATATASSDTVPVAAFSDHTGVSPTSVTVANISTQTAGLFKGGLIGAQAYAAYTNSTGGVNGRKLVVAGQDDAFSGAMNKQLTQQAVAIDFATVGDVSLEDSFGGTVLAANRQFPNVSETLDPTTRKLGNTFSAMPTGDGWPLGALVYFAKRFPAQIKHTGTIVADLPPTVLAWNNEKAAMLHEGYQVDYSPALPPTQTDFTAQVVDMRNAGIQIVFLEQMPQNYASAFIKDLNQQNFHPLVVLGSPAYSKVLVANSGGAAAIDGAFFEQQSALYLGEDASAIPAVTTFDTWVTRTAPGFQADLFTLEGWLNAQLFVQALRNAGSDPSRGSLLRALHRITAFDSGNLIPVSNPAERVPITCYLLGELERGTFVRMDDPSIGSPTHGYRCDQSYFTAR